MSFNPSFYPKVYAYSFTLASGSTSQTKAITSVVNLSYATVELLGFTNDNAATVGGYKFDSTFIRVKFNSIIEIQADRPTADGVSDGNITVKVIVKVYKPFMLRQAVQRGLLTITGGAITAAAALTALGTKAYPVWAGFDTNAGTTANPRDINMAALALSGNNIVASLGAATTDTVNVPYQVVDPR